MGCVAAEDAKWRGEQHMNEEDNRGRYGAVVEMSSCGRRVVEYSGLEAEDFISRAMINHEHGYGAVPIGRLDPGRSHLPPHKVAWCRGYHGFAARDANTGEIAAMPGRIVRRIAFGGERGLLNLGARVPTGILGEDRDNYGGKGGERTIAEYERWLGRRDPTYFVTARGFGSGSGIYLYRVPSDWIGVGALKTRSGLPGGVETIQSHLRYLAAPGSAHHTSETYQLFHEANGPTPLQFALPAPDDPNMATYPEPWTEVLGRKSRKLGAPLDADEIAGIASDWVFDDHPYMLDAIVRSVREATGQGATRNATHRALWIAARQARAGCYPLSRAVGEIESAAVAAYAQRGLGLDLDDFARSVTHGVAGALDMSSAEVAVLGAWRGPDVERVQP